MMKEELAAGERERLANQVLQAEQRATKHMLLLLGMRQLALEPPNSQPILISCLVWLTWTLQSSSRASNWTDSTTTQPPQLSAWVTFR